MAEWQRVSTRYGGAVHALAVDEGTVWAASALAVHASTNGGRRWQTYPLVDVRPPVLAIAVTRSNVLIGTSDGLWRSRDGCSTWQPVLGDAVVHSLAAT